MSRGDKISSFEYSISKYKYNSPFSLSKVKEVIEALSYYDGDDNITFYFLKNDTLTNCQVEDISFYSDTMGVEFTIQDTSEVQEEVDV